MILIAYALLYAFVLAILACMIPYAWIGIVIWAIIRAFKKGYQYTACGSAKWSDEQDLRRAGMLGGNGLIIGRTKGKPSQRGAIGALFNRKISAEAACKEFLAAFKMKPVPPLVRLNNAVHTAVFAPTGVGKGVSCVLPFLLECEESCVVIDPKGENAKLTMAARRAMGHKIVLLDPFKVVTEKPDSFNPLNFIDANKPTAIDECRDLAEALVVRTGQEKEAHWADSAEVWIGAMLATVATFGEGDDKSLQAVRTLLTDSQKMEAAIKLMCQSDVMGGMLARLGHQLTHFKDKELNSTLTTTNRFLRFLDTLAVADSTKSSSFDPADLLKGRMTVYLVLPPEHMRAQAPLLRMWIGGLLRAVVRGGLQEERKVHFVLDEAASLGHMNALDDAVSIYRGYGVRLQFYYQSLGQLKKSFPDGQEQTLLSNVTQVFFGVNELQTAEYVSNRLGEQTIIVASGGTSYGTTRQNSQQGQGSSYSSSSNQNDNWAQQARKLLKPEEVMGLPERIAVTFTPGVPPIWTTLVRYYEGGFGKKPGQFLPMVKEFGEAVLLASAMGFFAVLLTGLACQR
jgi:type IV secretion system protein VirD4